MVWDLCSMDSSNITKEFSEKRKRKIPLGTKGRTSILSVESSRPAELHSRSAEKAPYRECFVTCSVKGDFSVFRLFQKIPLLYLNCP